jgi:hypothetical protein
VNVQDAPIPTFPRRTGEGELAETVFERAALICALGALTYSLQPTAYSQPTCYARRLHG